MTPLPAGKPSRGLGLAIALSAACFWLVDLGLLRGGTPHPLDDTWEYGLVARSLLAGHGFRTPLIHPPLFGLHDAAWTVPMLVHGPLLPLAGAPFLRLFGAGALDHVAWLAAAFAVGTAVFTGRAVARHAGGLAGFVAAGIVTLAPVMVRMVHHDIAPVAGACAFAVLLDCIARPRGFLAGLAAGAGALVRPELLLAAPFAGWTLGASRVVPFLLGLGIVVAPWAWHTARAAGTPFFNLSSYLLIAYTPAHPGLSPLWDFALTPSRWPAELAHSLPALPAKWLHFGPRAIKHALMSPAPGFGAIAAIGLFATFQSSRTRRYAQAAFAVALIPLAMVTLTESSERYVAVFLPLWAIGIVQSAEMLHSGNLRKRLARLSLLAVMLPFTIAAVVSATHEATALRGWLAQERAALQPLAIADGRPIYSDTPDFVAWTTRRPAIAIDAPAYLALPAASDTATTPARGEPSRDEWFHADVRALPAPTGGGPADIQNPQPGRGALTPDG